MTRFLSRMNPLRAFRDLRVFLDHRGPQDIWFMIAAMAATLFLIWAFAKDSSFERAYKPDIVYVEQWTLNRTDAEIMAQQKIDKVKKDRQLAEQRAREEKLRASFKKLDDQLNRMGI